MQYAKLDFQDEHSLIEECVDTWGADAVENLLAAEGERVIVLKESADNYYDIQLRDGTVIESINGDFLIMEKPKLNKANIKKAIEHLQQANACQQLANLPQDEDDVSYELHTTIENMIEVLEEYL